MGRKRHIVVDTMGLLLTVTVHPADIQDRDGAKPTLERLAGRFPRLELMWADGAYTGNLAEWARNVGGWTLELVRRPPPSAHVQGSSSSLGCGTYICLVGKMQEAEQGLRRVAGDHRSMDL